MTAFITTSTANLQLTADPEMRGRVIALQSVVVLGTTPIGGPITGVVCEVLGPRAALVLGGVAALAAAAFGYWVISRRPAPQLVELDTGPECATG